MPAPPPESLPAMVYTMGGGRGGVGGMDGEGEDMIIELRNVSAKFFIWKL
jgi:hypothetical protein